MKDDVIYRRDTIDAINTWDKFGIDERSRVVRWHEGLEPYIKLRDVVWAIEKMPSAQLEHKKGHWERHNTYYGDDISGSIDPDWRCSECGGQANINVWCLYDLTDFCPNCGADTRGEKK